MKKAPIVKPKRKTLKQLEDEIYSLNQNEKALNQRIDSLRVERDKALQAEKKTREHFDDLKQRLLCAENETSRLRGYLDRVHEDDIVRDGMIEIEDDKGKRLVPKRPNPMQMASAFIAPEFINQPGYLPYGNEKITHWTNY